MLAEPMSLRIVFKSKSKQDEGLTDARASVTIYSVQRWELQC